jgi:hypothetical protein
MVRHEQFSFETTGHRHVADVTDWSATSGRESAPWW